MSTCGRCLFGKLVPQDFTKRYCWGGPPQLIGIPKMTKTGPIMEFQNFRPTVSADEPACGLFKQKQEGALVIDGTASSLHPHG